MYEGKIVLLEN